MEEVFVLVEDKEQNILLIQMPWATINRPSIALGILSQICKDLNIPVSTYYPNLDMAAKIGLEASNIFASERVLFGLSEHLFAVDYFGTDLLCSDKYISTFAKLYKEHEDEFKSRWSVPVYEVDYLKQLRDQQINDFLNSLLKRIIKKSPTVVAFTATFNQVMSSLALAKRIKNVNPEIQIVAGGSCFHGVMGIEYQRAFNEVLDHVFIGEAEESFYEYLIRLKSGITTNGIPGVTYFSDGTVNLVPGFKLDDLNKSPIPDYDDYFSEINRIYEETGLICDVDALPFESSRGCWWGEKSHCIFCGNNEETLKFRAKAANRVVEDIVILSAKYKKVKLTATDWILSKYDYLEIFNQLKELDIDLELFYEVRPKMKKSHVKLMYEAGVVRAQPGIESFSTPLLKLLKKGTRAISQIEFLRWCKEIGIKPYYNLLAGIPGEKSEWYLEMAKLIPRIYHLEPPRYNLNFIEMHRFAPLYEYHDRFGIEDCDLRVDYHFNLPDGIVDPLKIGYFFSFQSPNVNDLNSMHFQVVREAVSPWIEAHKSKTPPEYSYSIGPGFLLVKDTRNDPRSFNFTGIYHDVILLCDEIQTRESLERDLAIKYSKDILHDNLNQVVDELIAKDILLEEGNLLLTLPIGHRIRTTEELRNYVLGDCTVKSQSEKSMMRAVKLQ